MANAHWVRVLDVDRYIVASLGVTAFDTYCEGVTCDPGHTRLRSYEDGNDANSLRVDPIFKMAHDLSPSERDLCSQSTISRLENLPDVRALLRMGRAMIDLYCESFKQVPKRIILDIDHMFDAVHGSQ